MAGAHVSTVCADGAEGSHAGAAREGLSLPAYPVRFMWAKYTWRACEGEAGMSRVMLRNGESGRNMRRS